ncbi:hypothetical protein [Acinetobacter tianfuensis]|uniref:Uncharacterized protein n=1 Tax=Acinetobacter tianfuensis TaxID=2419603 RepID=A0A3A8E9B8_9GAMM|nr:hypothetical protein [Acinetobacter tianfuensis]RKG30186.1 hypothetical protein D7V32_12235 [Acinetobacter tianfuensis]
MLSKLNSLNMECQKLIERLDQLDFVDPFSQYYFNEIKNIEEKIADLNFRSTQAVPTKEYLELSIYTSNEELDLIIKDMQLRYADNAKNADRMETKIFSNIHSYDFKAMNIKLKACVDFVDIYFQVEKQCSRHDIKKYLTEKTKIRHYIKECGKGYIIRLHDMNSNHLINQRIAYLNHFGLIKESLKITEVEVALDFYGYKHIALITALLKSLKLPNSANNLRLFKAQTGVFTPIPSDPIILHSKIENGYNIGINHKLADEYWHLYRKQTDHNGRSLPESEWRIRAEKNVKVNVLSKMDNRLVNFKRILLDCFKGIRFTQLKKHTSLEAKQLYAETVKAFGIENESYRDASRNYRALPKDIEMNSDLNKLALNAICNLAKNFNHHS